MSGRAVLRGIFWAASWLWAVLLFSVAAFLWLVFLWLVANVMAGGAL